MWGRLTNLASTVAGADEESVDMNLSEAETPGVSVAQGMDVQILVTEQDKMIAQLKEMIRDQAKVLAERDGELKKVNGEFSKVKLQFKSKVASLSKQLSQAQKSASDNIERSSVGSEGSVSTLASESTSTADHTSRARLQLLRKQLKDRERLLSDKDAHIAQLCGQLETKDRVISELDSRISALPTAVESSGGDVITKAQPQVTDEMLIEQIKMKESRILELDTQIHQINQTVIDLRENLAEKDEVIRARDEAVQIIQAAFAERAAEREVDLGNAAKKLANSEDAFQEVIDALQQRLLETSEKLSTKEKSLEQVTADCQLKDQTIAQLSEHVEVVNGKCTTLERGYSEIYGNYMELMKSHQSLEASLNDLQRERNYLNERSSSLEQQCLELTKQLKESEAAREKVDESSREELMHSLANLDSDLRHEKGLLEQKHSALEQSHATLEQSYIQLQMLNNELEQSHSASMSSSWRNDELQRMCVDLEQQKMELEQRCSDLEHNLAVSRSQVDMPESGDLSTSYSPSYQDSLIEQLKKNVESSESRFSKFKALAGSKIKALESEVEELKKNSTDVTEFRNRIAELEEEKGNLQLQLLDSDDFKPGYFDAKLAQMEQHISGLQKDNSDLKDAKNSLENTLLQKSDQSETQLAMNLELEKQVASLSAELEASRELVCGLQVKLDSLVAENLDLKDTKSSLENTLLQKSDQKLELEKQVASLSTELEASRELVCNLNSLVANQTELENQKVHLTSEMHVKDVIVDELTKKVHEKELEIKSKTHELEGMRTETDRLERKLAESEKTAETFATQIQDYQRNIDNITLELNVKQTDSQGLLVDLKSKRQEIEELQYLVNEKDRLIKQVEADLIGKDACIAELKADVERKLSDLESLKNQVKCEDGSINNLKSEIVFKSQRITSLEQEVAQKNTLIESLNEELHQKNIELATLSSRQNDDYISHSNLNGEINRLQIENDKLLSTISRLENEVVRLSDSLTASIAECEMVKSNDRLVSEQEADWKSLVDSLKTQADEAKYSLRLKEEEMEKLKVVPEELSEALKSTQNELQEKNNKMEALLQQIKDREEEVHIREMEQEGIINSKKLEIEKLFLKLDEMEKHSSNLKLESSDELKRSEELSNQLVNVQTELRLTQEKLEQEKLTKKATENQLLSSVEELTSQQHKAAEEVAILRDRCEEERRKCEGLAKKLSLSETRVASLSENLEEEEAQLIAVTQELDKYKVDAEQLATRFSAEHEKVTASKDLDIERLSTSLQEKDTQIKKYIVVIKKMKQHLKDEKAKTEATLEKAETSVLDQSVESLKDAVKPEDDQQIAEELHKRVDELSRELEKKSLEMSSVLESNDKSIGELKGALRDATLRCDAAQSTVSRLERVRDENLRLEEELSACKKLQLDLASKVDELSQLNVVLQQDVQRSASAVQESQVELQHAMMEIARWKHLAEDTQATVEKLSLEVEASQSSQDKLSRDFDSLNDQLSRVIAEKEVLVKEFEKSHDRSELFGVELEEITAKKSQLEQELITVREILDGLSIENKQLKLEAIYQPAEVIANVNLPNEEQQLVAESVIKLRDTPVKEVQLLFETAQRSSPVLTSVSTDVYQQMEKQYLDLQNSFVEAERRFEEMKQENGALILKLEDFQNGSMTVRGGSVKLDGESLRVELAEAKKAIAVLEGHLKESAFKHDTNLATFEQIRRNLEFDKMMLEGELSKVNERAMKAESLLHHLGAELDTERERFSEREEELEGSSEELQLEVAKLSQHLEQAEEKCHTLQMENERLKVEVKHFGSEKEQILTSTRAEYQAREKDLLNKIDHQGGCIEKLSLEKERLNAEVISLSETSDKRYAELTRQYEMLNLDISTYQDLVHDLKGKNSHLELLLKQASTGHDDVSSDLVRLEGEKNSLLRDKQNLEDEVEMMQSRVILLAQEKEKLEDEIERIEVRELLLSQDKQKVEAELEAVLGRELLLSEVVEELKSKLNDFSSTEEELEETQNRLFTLQAENTELNRTVVGLQRRVEDLSAVEIEANALQDRYLALLQDNNALIRQSKEMYEKIRGGGVAVEQLQTSSVSNNGIIESLTKEVNVLNAQLASLKSAHQTERRAQSDESKELREKLLVLESELGIARSALGKRAKPEEAESLRLELQQLKVKYEQCRAKLRVAVTESKNQMRSQQPDGVEIDDCPKVHASIVQSAPSPTTSVGSSHGDKDGDFLRLKSKNAELIAEKDDLTARLHTAEQAVTQREHDMVHVHQQYQLLYQQFASLQLHYTALEQRLQGAGSPSESHHSIADDPKVVAMLNERLQMLERQLNESSNESTKLRKQLLSESESRIQAEDMLREQIQLHQQLSAHAAEQRSIAIEPDEDRVDYRLKLTSLLSGQRDIRKVYQLVRQWCESNSIMLGRKLRGQPRLRKSILAYFVLLHVYVLFACVLSSGT